MIFSGGPITWQGAVVGIASWTLRPCGTVPQVFTRVTHFLDWIREQLLIDAEQSNQTRKKRVR